MNDHQSSLDPNQGTDVDVAIVGGGIAGCWLLRLLHQNGYRTVLFEADELGCAQTLASQGMIHGGLKYALGGALTGASEAIAGMPDRWRKCLAGKDPVDLSGVPLLADTYHMFAEQSTRGRLTTFLASKALRGRVTRLAPADCPAAFAGFEGIVYDLNDFVMDIPALLQRLTQGLEPLTYRARIDPKNITPSPEGFTVKTANKTLRARTLISCAGNGSNGLIEGLDLAQREIQHRPLKQVIVRPRHGVRMNAHCVTGIVSNEPRLTITSYGTGDKLVWYVGGLIAETGIDRSDDSQIDFARAELTTCIPWLDWTGAEYATLDVDRAEPFQQTGLKPDEAFVEQKDNFMQCFPIKLTLAPDLGDRVLERLPPPSGFTSPMPDSPNPAAVGHFRW